jgi:sulfatase modifying factor 1
MKLVLIQPGEFMMGSRESAEELAKAYEKYVPDIKPGYFQEEYPYHRVRITKPFYLGAYEVTVGQFRKFVEDSAYKTDAEKDGKGGYGIDPADGKFGQKPEYTWRSPAFAQTDEHPVVNVSWNDAVAFCEWLSRKEGKTYRLPTEAQWEYACRGGTNTRYWSGDDPETLMYVGNVADATAKAKFPDWKYTILNSDGYVFTAPVGQFRANPFGLYDMHGNVYEWCADWYDAAYYGKSSPDDPTGSDSGASRVLRGGSWVDWPYYSRSADRIRYAPDYRNYNTGFRVSRTP